jgi:hypothetical protein
MSKWENLFAFSSHVEMMDNLPYPIHPFIINPSIYFIKSQTFKS